MGRVVSRAGVLVEAVAIRVPPGEWSLNAALVAATAGAPADAVWWVEHPRVYGDALRARREDVQELRDLAEAVKREMVPLGATVHLIEPFAWKRQVPKPVHHRRIKAVLSRAELEIVNEATESFRAARLDVWDAVGINLYGLGRLAPGGARN